MVDLSVLGGWLDSMILVIFSNLNDSDSILTIFKIHPGGTVYLVTTVTPLLLYSVLP